MEDMEDTVKCDGKFWIHYLNGQTESGIDFEMKMIKRRPRHMGTDKTKQ